VEQQSLGLFRRLLALSPFEGEGEVELVDDDDSPVAPSCPEALDRFILSACRGHLQGAHGCAYHFVTEELLTSSDGGMFTAQ
jgi:hypothetical protein